MSSVGDTEVFIPEQANVITVPVCSLPSSITRKMSVCPVHSDRPATFICPVELRETGTTRKPRPLTPGQFSLPVVTSNRKAFRMLQNFLLSGENSLQFSDENSRAGSTFSRTKNSIILFKKQIFLIVRKAKAPDWPLEPQSSAPSENEAPPLDSPQDERSDITEGTSKEGACGAVDHGKCAEKPSGDDRDEEMECEAQNDDITDRKRSKEDHGKCVEVLKEREADVVKDREENESHLLMKDASVNTPSSNERRRGIKQEEERGVGALGDEAQSLLVNAEDGNGGEIILDLTSEEGCASNAGLAAETRTEYEKSSSDNLKHEDKTKSSKHDSSLAKAKCCKHLIFRTVPSPPLMNVKERQDKSDSKAEISEVEIPSDKKKSLVSAAEIIDVRDENRVPQNITEDANEDVATSNISVSIQESDGQRSCCETAVEIVDVNDDDRVSNVSSGVTNISTGENSLENFESLKRDDIDSDDLIIVESDAEVESVTARSDTEVVEVDCSGVDKPNHHVSTDKRHGNKTSCKAKRTGPVSKVASSSAEAQSCESVVEIIDVDGDQVSPQSTNDTIRDAARSKSCDASKLNVCLSPTVKRCESAVEIMDLDDEVIINNRKIVNVHRRQLGDVAKGCKRRIFNGVLEETNSDVAQISEVNGLSAKRSKRNDDANECRRLESGIDQKSQVKNSNENVEIIEVDDDDDDEDGVICRSASNTNENVAEIQSCTDETKVQRNRGNAEDSSDKVSCRKGDRGIFYREGRPGDGVESQSSLEKIKSCKRGVSKSDSIDDAESCSQARINETKDSSAERFQLNVTNPGGKTCEKSARTQSSVAADNQNDLINNKNSSKAHDSEHKRLLSKSDVEITAVRESDQVVRKNTQEPNQGVTDSIHDLNKTTNQTLAAEGLICQSHIKKVQNKNAAEIVETSFTWKHGSKHEQEQASSDEQHFEVINDCEVLSAAEDRALAGKSYAEEPNPDVTSSEASGWESEDDDVLVEEDKDSESGDGVRLSATVDPDQVGKFAADQLEATNQSTRGDQIGVLCRPMSPRVRRELDYVGLRQEENISRIRARLRGMEEKLKTLINLHH